MMQDTKFLVPNAFVKDYRAQGAHIDGYGHVNNVVYLEWAMDIAWAHSEALGYRFADFEANDCGFIVHRHELQYRLPLHQGETAVVGTWLTQNDGRWRLRRRFQFVHKANGKTLALAATDFVCVTLSSARARRMPPEYVTAYAAHPGAEDILSKA